MPSDTPNVRTHDTSPRSEGETGGGDMTLAHECGFNAATILAEHREAALATGSGETGEEHRMVTFRKVERPPFVLEDDRSEETGEGENTRISGTVYPRKVLDKMIADAFARGAAAGREQAVKACQEEQIAFASPEYATGQPDSSFAERFACGRCIEAIEALPLPKDRGHE